MGTPELPRKSGVLSGVGKTHLYELGLMPNDTETTISKQTDVFYLKVGRFHDIDALPKSRRSSECGKPSLMFEAPAFHDIYQLL